MTYHNTGILAHVDSGKTTFTEQLLYLCGTVHKAGSVDSGTAATDSLAVERERGISVRTSSAAAEWKNVTFNIIDTPGHVDFAGEVERSLCALDYAVVLVSAVEGVRAHTENILHALDAEKLPRLIFINKTDRAGSDYASVVRELEKLSSAPLVVLTQVDGEGFDTVSCRTYDEAEFAVRVTEALAEIDSEAEEAFLEDKPLAYSRAAELLKQHIADRTVVPVLCGSAKLGVGMTDAADFMAQFMPSAEMRAVDGLSGVIFKIEHDKTMGKLAHIRLFGGEIKSRDEVTLQKPADKRLVNPNGEENDAVELEAAPPVTEKVTQIRKFTGGKYTDSGKVCAGDIAALCGMTSARAGQFVGNLELSDEYRLASPFLRVKVTPADGDSEKIESLAYAMKELSDEEPYIDAKWENGQKEIIISTTGKIQLEILGTILKERYKLDASFSDPTVIYKETPAREGFAYADYTMPKPCWAVVQFKFEPMPRGYGVSYHGKLPSNQCFYRYQTHIRTSFYNCLEQGLYGWEVTDFRCTLVGGQHHTIHTHPLDFFVCTPMAFMNGLQSLGSTILEPLLKMRISIQTHLSGKVINSIAQMGGEYDNPVIIGDTTIIEAIVPAAKSMDFPLWLTSLSSGRAVVSRSFYGYRECNDGEEHINPRRGVNPLDRSKWILWARGAYQLSADQMFGL